MDPKLDLCPVCGRPLTSEGGLVRAWPGKYAHSRCASYERRPPRSRAEARSHRVHGKFTRR